MVKLSDNHIAQTNSTFIFLNSLIDSRFHIRETSREDNYRVRILSYNTLSSNEFITIDVVVFSAADSQIGYTNGTPRKKNSRCHCQNSYFFHFNPNSLL